MIRSKSSLIRAILITSLFSVLFFNHVSYSAMVLPIDTIILDTLEHGAIEITAIDYNEDTLYVDTSSRHGLIMDVCGKFKSYEYCYIGRIDSVVSGISDYPVPYDTQLEIPEYYIDTVYVSVDTVLKGEVGRKEYTFLDSQSTIKPLYDYTTEGSLAKSSSAQEIHYNSYSQISGRKIIFFGSEPYNLRKSTIKPGEYYAVGPAYMYYPWGHYIDDSARISNLREFPYVHASKQDFYDAVFGRFSIKYNPLVYIQMEKESPSPIVPPLYPSPDFEVSGEDDETFQRVAAVFDSSLNLLKAEDSIVSQDSIVRGYFEKDSLNGWEHSPLCFFITDVLDETKTGQPAADRDNISKTGKIRFNAQSKEIVFVDNSTFTGSTISIFNVSGREIFSKENISNQNNSIKIPGYISGPCFIKFNNGDKNIIKKLLILR